MRTVRTHLTYANVVATICLFGLLGGATAYAANTIFSTDIVDGQVKTADLANGAATGAKLADGSITGDKVKDGALQGRDVLDNSLKGADIDESTLSGLGGGGGSPVGVGVVPPNGFDGPLPKESDYESSGGTLLISVSGSGFRPSGRALGPGRIGMDLLVDGAYVATAEVHTNERDSHKAFVSASAVVEGLAAGLHTIRLQAANSTGCGVAGTETPFRFCTDTDSADSFYVSVVEAPD